MKAKKQLVKFFGMNVLFRKFTLTGAILTYGLGSIALSFAFSDVPRGDSEYLAIKYLERQGVVNGYSDQTFRPEQAVNRVEALKMILVATQLTITPQESVFSDVPPESWFSSLVNFAAARGIISGEGAAATFNPDRSVNLAEFLKMLLESFEINAQEYPIPEESMLESDQWYAPYFSFANHFNLLPADWETINPGMTLNRSHCAQLIFNTLYQGKGLNTKTLLTLNQEEILTSVENMGISLSKAQRASQIAQSIADILLVLNPEDSDIQAVDSISQAIGLLVQAFDARELRQHDRVIMLSQEAWSLSEESLGSLVEFQEMSQQIKKIAEALASEARSYSQE